MGAKAQFSAALLEKTAVKLGPVAYGGGSVIIRAQGADGRVRFHFYHFSLESPMMPLATPTELYVPGVSRAIMWIVLVKTRGTKHP